MRLLITLFFFLTIKSCGNTKAAISETNNKMQNIFPEAISVGFVNGKDVNGKGLTLKFNTKNNMVTGYAGCNNYSGKLVANGSKHKVTNIMSTKRYCKDMEIEKSFLKTIGEDFEIINKNGTYSLIQDKQTAIVGYVMEDIVTTGVQANTTLIYKAHTRGFYNAIIINNGRITLEMDRSGSQRVKDCTREQWNTLKELVSKTNLENLAKHEAPSTKRFVDAAPIAQLIIEQNGKTYTSQQFDHGNPPEAYASLVKQLTSLMNAEEKK